MRHLSFAVVSVVLLAFPALVSAQLQGQIVPDPEDPSWLAYHGGGSYFLCGPGDPEGFLYRGTRNADGTRAGDQASLISRLIQTGANSIYLMALRSHGGDGGSTENPFIDSNPANGFDQDILDQWEGWFTQMDQHGITIFFFLYDDSSRVWGSRSDDNDTLTSDELTYVNTLVNRFEHHTHIIWVVAEEYQERFTAAETSNYAAAIRAADDNNHVIAVHKLTGLSFAEFADDPNVDQFAIQYKAASPADNHSAMVNAWNQAQGKYNLNLSEPINTYGTGRDARLKSWAIAMGGAYVMPISWDIASTPADDSDLVDCKRLIDFMERADLTDMEPRDDLAYGGTEYVLAKPGERWIAYASALPSSIGVRGVPAGQYDFTWLDIASGATVNQNGISAAAGDHTWPLPSGIGVELAVYIRPVGSSSGGPQPNPPQNLRSQD